MRSVRIGDLEVLLKKAANLKLVYAQERVSAERSLAVCSTAIEKQRSVHIV